MPNLKRKIKETKGFVAIVALGMLVLMSYFAIMAQETNIRMLNHIKASINYHKAKDLGFSGMEYLQWRLSHHEAGYNLKVECEMQEGILSSNTNHSICDDFLANSPGNIFEGADVSLVMEIKGRGNADEQFTGTCPGIGGNCYVVPFPGTGDAGENCNAYYPFIPGANNAGNAQIGHNAQYTTQSGASGVDYMPQIDYSCNWNKLTFGSSVTDRAAIPFYYDEDDDAENDWSTIANPFNGNLTGNFVLRMRTPCKPCEDRTGGVCSGNDETICKDGDRYVLDAGSYPYTSDENDVVVQWQLTGRCIDPPGTEEKECGLIQYVKLDSPDESSAISESRINNNDIGYNNKIVLDSMLGYGIDTNTYSLTNLPTVIRQLRDFQNPTLSLFLSGKLFSIDGERVPYLEYQVLSNEPTANPRIQLDVTAVVNKSTYERTLYRDETKDLIDFAVQY